MSFSADQKKEIIEYTYKSSCCRRALLSGLLFGKGRVQCKKVTMSFDKAEYADFASKLIHEFYSKEGRIFRENTGGRRIDIVFESPSAAKYVNEIDNLTDFDVCDIITQRCASCLSSFLRGVF